MDEELEMLSQQELIELLESNGYTWVDIWPDDDELYC